jgi:hypothetical protein
MVNFTDIIAQCTIAAARNNCDPDTEMKDAILQFTTKPKWSCYFDLHKLPPQGDIRPSQLMTKLISLMPTPPPWPRLHPPGTGPGPPMAATATAAATTIAAHHPAAAVAGDRHLTTTLRKTTTEFVGITTNSSTSLTDAFPLATGRETARPPDKANAASGGDRRSKNRNSNVLFTWLRIIIFKR